MVLTQKESSMIKDMKDQEKLCVEKYTKHSSCAKDPQLKNLFTYIAGVEQKHYDSLTQLEGGTVPAQGTGENSSFSFSANYANSASPDKANDSFLCMDLLSGEKHVSHLYDTSIFEFKDSGARSFLNHIQKEEQEHGKLIYDYMSVNGMYS